LTGDEIKAVLRGEDIHRDEAPTAPADGGGKSSVPTSKKKKSRSDGPSDLEPEPQPGS
jgi:hypothetical protein